MKGRVVSVANLKGGVGKTTTAVMLADGLSLQEAREGGRLNKVLVIDADPQASLGFALAGVVKIKQVASDHLSVNTLMNRSVLHEQNVDVGASIVGNISRVYGTFASKTVKGHISLIASSPAMVFAEQMIVRAMTKKGLSYDETLSRVFTFVTDDLLNYARQHYDWTIIDCAPGMNMLTRTSICASDATLVTTVPEPLATFGFDIFLHAVWTERFDLLPAPQRPLVLLTRVKASETAHGIEIDRIGKAVRDTPPFQLLNVRVPEAAAVDGQLFLKAVPMTLKGRYRAPMAGIVAGLAAEVREIVDAV